MYKLDPSVRALQERNRKTMYRWATFLLLVTFLLIQSHSLQAQTLFQHTGQAPPLPPVKPTPSHFATATCSTTPDQQLDTACFTAQSTSALAELVQTADLIVRGRVRAVHSFWRADQRIIESDVTLDIAYQLLGAPLHTLTIRTPGGYLAAQGIGMVSLHAATFTVGEEVLLFAYQQAGAWRLVGGATSKFLVQENMVINEDLALRHSMAGVLPTIVELIRKRGLQAQLPTPWRHLATAPAAPSAQPMITQPDNRKWATPHAGTAFYLNLNTAQIDNKAGNRKAFRQAILAAATSWSQVAGADFTLAYAGETNATTTGYNGVNEVLFMHKGAQERAGAAQVWYTADQTIIEADIWINDDYTWNATGSPEANEVDLQSALLHEFGHWLILGHSPDTDAVMFARLTAGTLKRELQPQDQRGISAIYPQ
jgi:hypothetical protein